MNERPALSAFRDYAPVQDDIATAVIEGLSRAQKALPCKLFYDRRGSQIFEEICELDEYYLTRTELALLTTKSAEIAALAGPAAVHLVEYGSGAGYKVRLLLRALVNPAAYTAVDISRDHLLEATTSLARDYPRLLITAICADYSRPFDLSGPRELVRPKRIGFFPGSTIGNFTPSEAISFLRGAASVLGPDGEFIVGVDLKKDSRVLDAAYDDAKGVTAAFNLNILVRINRELGANFDLAHFKHRAHYNAIDGRIEMYLASVSAQDVRIFGQVFHFAAGETIHTENSYKYTIEEFQAIAHRAGFLPLSAWTDQQNLFSIHYLRAGAA